MFEDRPPRVAFEQPDEALEVHPIAEVLNRIRVADDFGLTRAGIVFQFNDGDEKTLVLQDFHEGAGRSPDHGVTPGNAAAGEARRHADGQRHLLRVRRGQLPRPARGGPRPTCATSTSARSSATTSWPSPPTPARRTDEFATLDELIARQRFNLNRANRLAKHKPTDRTIAEDPLKIAGFEETLVQTDPRVHRGGRGDRRPADRAAPRGRGIDARGGRGARPRPERAGPGPHGRCPPPSDRGAATHFRSSSDRMPSASKTLRSFDRKQAQKIRKPKKDQEEAEEIADETRRTRPGRGLRLRDRSPAYDGASRRRRGRRTSRQRRTRTRSRRRPSMTKKEEQEPKKRQGPKGPKGAGNGQGRGQKGEKGTPKDEDSAGESEEGRPPRCAESGRRKSSIRPASWKRS